MNNSFTMAINLREKEHRQKAIMVTAGFTAFAILLMIFLKWKLPAIEIIAQEPGIEVELNLPPDPPIPETQQDGGGGGGNPVHAAGEAGIAPHTPPAPGEEKDSKDLEDNNDKEATPIIKPVATKPNATTITNTSTAKVERPVETPAPPRPKAVLGKTTTGTGRGGGADDYDKPGGSGTGSGVGNGSGTGGGNGSGNGGGNGSGSGGGSGVKKVSGNRYVPSPKGMNAGENINGKVKALIRVTPEGIGTLMQTTAGSLQTNPQAKDIIRDWLRNNRFNPSSESSIVEYEFNIRMN
jgi:hypothetical protein